MKSELVLMTEQSWQQGSDEPDAAYAGFLAFANLPKETRSLREAFRHFKEQGGRASLTVFLGWSKTYRWQERVLAWDAHRIQRVEDVWVQREIESREKMWRLSNEIFDRALQTLKALGDEKIPASALARLLDVALRLEQAATPRSNLTPSDIRSLLQALPKDTRVRVVQLLMAETK
jgi:hypothetical protein